MARERRKNFLPQEKVRSLREHLVERRPVSAVCQQFGIRPSQLYQSQAQLFEHGGAAFRREEDPWAAFAR
jgi:transposase-like protein